MQALILCGGLGTRLRPLTNEIPKPKVPIDSKPFLEYLIDNLKRFGIVDIILAVGYKEEIIREYFGDGLKIGVNIKYSVEKELLGTAGAIWNAHRLLNSDFMVINGDTYLDIDFEKFIYFHKLSKSRVTMALINSEDVSRYGSVIIDSNNNVVVDKKGNCSDKGLINAGYYLLNKEIMDNIPANTNCSLQDDIFPNIRIKGFISNGYFIDIGVFESYEKFKNEFKYVVN